MARQRVPIKFLERMCARFFLLRLLPLLVIAGCAMATPIHDATVAAAADDATTREQLCPRIVTRAQWKARKPIARQPLVTAPTPYVVVHHGGEPLYCHDESGCSAIVRSYQDLHMDVRGWADIGYNFVIGEDGNVYEARGWDLVGAHAPGYNGQSIGICIIGNFNDFLPNDAALKALRSLMSCGVSLNKIREDYNVIGHRQARSTECPGQALYEYVQRMPNWTGFPKAVFLSTNST